MVDHYGSGGCCAIENEGVNRDMKLSDAHQLWDPPHVSGLLRERRSGLGVGAAGGQPLPHTQPLKLKCKRAGRSGSMITAFDI